MDLHLNRETNSLNRRNKIPLARKASESKPPTGFSRSARCIGIEQPHEPPIATQPELDCESRSDWVAFPISFPESRGAPTYPAQSPPYAPVYRQPAAIMPPLASKAGSYQSWQHPSQHVLLYLDHVRSTERTINRAKPYGPQGIHPRRIVSQQLFAQNATFQRTLSLEMRVATNGQSRQDP
ncbi:protein of unknown function [Azospirillum lipoferum 4B]|uniref:Uncharacterized protein n=1 Tax=Azospirillum lipoferum (strain 4B) TaxID=862719 RepID=G7Z3I7_AZOL4|nr:protein of unknown function [Azospirillum lipoferum 4B]